MLSPLILVARGSRHPLTTPAVMAVAMRVAAAHPGRRVRAAFLDAEVPSVAAALAKEAGLAHREAIVVPMLLTMGRHARISLPDTMHAAATARLPMVVRVTEGLGPVAGPLPDTIASDLLVQALWRRLGEALGGRRPDVIVLAAAGSRSTRAMQTAEDVARSLAAATGVACRAAFTTIGTATVGDAVAAQRRAGAATVAVATYLLTPGVLYDRVLAEAERGGAAAVAPPLGDAPEIVQLVAERAERAEIVGRGSAPR